MPEVDVSVPALIVRLDKETLLLPRVNVPDPAFVKLYELPDIAPPIVRVLALTVT